MTGRPDLLLTQIDTNTRTTRAMPNSAWNSFADFQAQIGSQDALGGIFPLSILTFAALSGGEPCWLVQDSVASPPPTQRAAQEVAAYHILAILEVRGWQTQAEVENRQLCRFFQKAFFSLDLPSSLPPLRRTFQCFGWWVFREGDAELKLREFIAGIASARSSTGPSTLFIRQGSGRAATRVPNRPGTFP